MIRIDKREVTNNLRCNVITIMLKNAKTFVQMVLLIKTLDVLMEININKNTYLFAYD